MRKVLFILSQLSDKDIDWMLAIGKREEIAAGTLLIQEGQPIDALYIVLHGTLTVSIASLAGWEIGTIGCGEVLGEMSFVDDRPPVATVKAIEDSVVLSISRKLLTEKLQEDAPFALRFYRSITKFLSHRLRGTVSRLSFEIDDPPEGDSQADEPDLPPGENIALARTRFDQLIGRLKGS